MLLSLLRKGWNIKFWNRQISNQMSQIDLSDQRSERSDMR